MDDVVARFWTDLVGRLTGPLAFRFLLQPARAALFALRDGLNDARAGRPAYLWAIFSHPEDRRHLFREGWKSVGKVVILAIVLDLAYQLIVFRRIYPLEAIAVAVMLAVLPYCLLRGPFSRISRHRIRA